MTAPTSRAHEAVRAREAADCASGPCAADPGGGPGGAHNAQEVVAQALGVDRSRVAWTDLVALGAQQLGGARRTPRGRGLVLTTPFACVLLGRTEGQGAAFAAGWRQGTRPWSRWLSDALEARYPLVPVPETPLDQLVAHAPDDRVRWLGWAEAALRAAGRGAGPASRGAVFPLRPDGTVVVGSWRTAPWQVLVVRPYGWAQIRAWASEATRFD